MTGLQDAVQEYLKAPPASTLPRPEFLTAGPSQSSLSVWLEEGLHQMSEVITAMSESVLSDQGSQERPVKNAWKNLKEGETATSSYPWTEYWFNGEVCLAILMFPLCSPLGKKACWQKEEEDAEPDGWKGFHSEYRKDFW